MDETPKSSGWWQTLPGILTATAAVLTAIGGLLVAFHQAGFFNRSAQNYAQVQNDTAKPAQINTIASATKPSSSAETTKSSSNAETVSYPITTLAGTEIRVGESVYKILAARFDRYAPGKLSLRFDVLMTNNGRFPANFWSESFRLLEDGVPRAPDNPLNELVESHSAKEGMVEFVIPDTVNELGLQVGEVGEGKAAIPIPLKASKP